ncbi:hypothetical protein IFR05_007390 [Cadophora sp. M221]|nr:hypothetical protein IFR05_007390 [Cadophora sp. M221]
MLGDHLRSATRPCSFCYHDLLKDAPNPGLFIKGFGPIAFPFLERDIDRIIKASKQSTMQQEVEDATISKTAWEIPSDMIELRNPSWGRLLASVLSKVSSELEIQQTRRGILGTKPTLILHEPNGIVNPIKCHFSQSPVFGFLDITLPSKYTGGELRVEHDGRKEVIPLEEQSEYDCSCLAWFHNVVSTSAPISSGHRLVLRYTLEHEQPGPVCRAIPLAQEIMKLGSILTSWTKQKDQVTHGVLGYMLDDKYEDRQLGKVKFSSSDQLALRQLIDACAEAGFYLCLSTMSGRIVSLKEVANGHRIPQQAERPSSTLQLGRIVDFEGKELLGNYRMEFLETNIVQDRPFDDVDYVTDEGSDSHDHYIIKLFQKTLVIIMPLEARTPFFYGVSAPDYNSRVKELLAQFCSLSKSAKEFTTLKNEIREVCGAVLATVSWDQDSVHSFVSGYAIEVQAYVLKAISLLDDTALLASTCPIGFANIENYKVLFEASKAHEPGWLKSSLTKQMAAIPDFLSRCMAISKIERWLPDTDWIHMLYLFTMTTLNFSTDRDIEGVVKVATLWAKDSRLRAILIPTLKRNLKGNDIILILLSRLSAETQVPDSVFKELMPQSVEHFIVGKQPAQRSYLHQLMANILLHCHNLGLSSPLQQAVTKISWGASKATPIELEHDYLGFLGKLAGTINKTSEGAEFKRENEQREHLEQRLRMGHPTTAKLSTIVGAGYPFALRVLKIGGPIDDPSQYWTKKHEVLNKAITSLGSKRLLHCLLGSNYTNMMILKPFYFSPIVSDASSELVDLTAADNRPSPSVPMLASHNVLSSNTGSRSVSTPVPLTASNRPTPSRDIVSMTTPPPSNWSAINLAPIQTNRNTPPFPLAAAESATSHQTTGQRLMSIRSTESPTIVGQSSVRSAPSHLLEQAAAALNTPTVSNNSPSSQTVIKAEKANVLNLQSTNTQHPARLGTSHTVASGPTISPRTLPPLIQTRNYTYNSIESVKRKDPPSSVEKEGNKTSQHKRTRRAQNEDPTDIPGGVWGSVETPFPPLPGDHVAPPPPAWLISSLDALRPKFPGHRFRAIMRHYPVSTVTNMPCSEPAAGQPVPADVKYMWIPRIQCEDCPAKLYIPGSSRSVTNFVFHLKNQMHTSNVEKRLRYTSS